QSAVRSAYPVSSKDDLMNWRRRIPVVVFAAASTMPFVIAQPLLFAQDDAFEDQADELIPLVDDAPVEADQPAGTGQAIRVRQRPNADRDHPPTAAELLHRLDESIAAAATTRAMLDELDADGEQADREKNRPADGNAAALAVRLIPEELHLGKVYGSDKHVRFLAVQLWIVNTGPARIDVPIEAIRLRIGDREIFPNHMPPRQGLPHLPFGRRVVPIEQLKREGVVTIPVGEAATLPVVFFDLPGANDVPAMTLQVHVD